MFDKILQGRETPLAHIEAEVPINDSGIDHIARQDDDKPMIARLEAAARAVVEADIERRDYRQRRHHEVVDDDQHAARIAEECPHGLSIVRPGR